MPLQAQQIVSLALQDADVPGFTSQAGQLLNSILQELCQTYDFDVTKKTYSFNFNPSQLNSNGQAYQNLPADYLRGVRNECFYIISGVPYPMIPLDLAEFDMLVEQAGLSNFPTFFATDMSLSGEVNGGTTGVPVALFWMPPSGAYPMTIRYFSQMPDITTPESSTTIPWFPNTTYLRRRLAGELMMLANEYDAAAQYLGDDDRATPLGAGVILRKYLKMADDKENRVEQVRLDRRRFGNRWDQLRSTKQIGW